MDECIIIRTEGGVWGCCLGSAMFGSLCLCSNLIKCENRGQPWGPLHRHHHHLHHLISTWTSKHLNEHRRKPLGWLSALTWTGSSDWYEQGCDATRNLQFYSLRRPRETCGRKKNHNFLSNLTIQQAVTNNVFSSLESLDCHDTNIHDRNESRTLYCDIFVCYKCIRLLQINKKQPHKSL